MNLNISNPYYQDDLSKTAVLEFIPWHLLNNRVMLITGATGLIGSFLIDVLMYRNMHYNSNILLYGLSRNLKYAQDRFNVYWNNSLFQFIKQDISDRIKTDEKFDFVIHGASNAYPTIYAADPVGTMKANLWGLINILDYSIDKSPKRVLYISSGEVYGEGEGANFVESYSGYIDCLNPRSCYPSSKRAAETLCVSYSSQYDIDCVIARPCHIYGPTITSSDNRAFAQFIRNVVEGNNVVLKSKGEQYRSYCYVADRVSALLMILLCGDRGNAYNIADRNSSVKISDLASLVADAGKQKVIFDMPSDMEKKGYSVITRAALDSSKIESLGWKAVYSLSDGIQQTINILLER